MLFCSQYVFQEVFVRLYFLVKVTPGKVSTNFTGYRGWTFCSSILLLLSDHMLFIMVD